MVKPSIITGAGRSGTHWVAGMLQRLKIDANHEMTFSPLTAETWNALQAKEETASTLDIFHYLNLRERKIIKNACEVSWMAAPYLSAVPTIPVVHLVRAPFAVARSMQGRLFNPEREADEPHTKFVQKHMRYAPRISKELDLCLQYWWTWNHMVEPCSIMRVRLEDLATDPAAWVEMLAAIGYSRTPEEIAEAFEVDIWRHASNDKESRPLVNWGSFTQLPHLDEIRAMANRYGYG